MYRRGFGAPVPPAFPELPGLVNGGDADRLPFPHLGPMPFLGPRHNLDHYLHHYHGFF